MARVLAAILNIPATLLTADSLATLYRLPPVILFLGAKLHQFANAFSLCHLVISTPVSAMMCSSHARRPFANYEHEDPTNCSYMLHLFLGLAIHENCLDRYGRNYENVSAVRETESRDMWNSILELAKDMDKWSKSTRLRAGVRYIINNFDKLTAYINDPRIEYTNNLQERMLRTEKLIEGSSLFRQTIEGRFVLDVLRTILETAVAAGAPVHEYLVSVLRQDPDEVAENPGHFTHRAWVANNAESAADRVRGDCSEYNCAYT